MTFVSRKALLEMTLRYAERQPIVPVDIDQKPLVALEQASQDKALIEEWFDELEPQGIGWRTDNLVVIDVGEGAHAELAWLEQELGALPVTRAQVTPSGGRHLIFRRPAETQIAARTLDLGVEVISGPDRYVVVAPSRNGHGRYKWLIADGERLPVPIGELPAEWVAHLSTPWTVPSTDVPAETETPKRAAKAKPRARAESKPQPAWSCPPRDSRLLVVESEMVSAFKVASRDGNTLSAVIRAAWDTGTLRTMTRNSPLSATGAHISIIGHITQEELRRHLDSTEAANGYANRFLWIAVKRSKLLPEGGNVDPNELRPHVQALKEAVVFSRKPHRLERDTAARELWHNVYPQLSEGEPGLVGSLLARAEAQVLRLSMLYALLDKSATIREEHLRAALAVWDYAARSTRYLFESRTGNPDADTIATAVVETGPLTRTQVAALFGRHRTAAQIDRAIAELVGGDQVEVKAEKTGGRPVERIHSLNSLSSLNSPNRDWPDPPSEEAFHGVLGQLVHSIEPHTEADPQGLLVQFLVGFGNAVGRTPYVSVEADKHHCNLFTVLVGDTSKARKGTSWGYARRVLTEVDPDWEARIKGGLSTGEGLIAQVADSEESELSEESRRG